MEVFIGCSAPSRVCGCRVRSCMYSSSNIRQHELAYTPPGLRDDSTLR